MDYRIDGTTKRYSGNNFCSYPDFTPKPNGLCQYGCEFEFYIDTSRYEYKKAIEAITKELFTLTHADILVDEISIPQAPDKNRCIQIKPDISLEDYGVEISIPISTQKGVIHFIETIAPLIDTYGYTNEETGFHIHVSTLTKDGMHIDFYRFMLLCDDANLLSSWKPRTGYSQNVMDILSSYTKRETRIIKTKKGTIWNLEKIDTHHIEIKSIGGTDYHKNPDRIIQEFKTYADLFIDAIGEVKSQHKKLLLEHKEKVNAASKEIKADFAAALGEAGILPQ